jgi:hypothetical protein
MPLELQIIRAREFIRMGAQGGFDLAASKSALANLAGACRKRGINQALLDLRALQPEPIPRFSASDLASLINTFREMGFTEEQKLAVLYTSDPHRRARLFAFIGRLRGWNVAAFDNFEKALYWLAGEETLDLEALASEQAIPMKSSPPPGSSNDPGPRKDKR